MPEWISFIFRYKEKKSPDKLGKYPSYIHTLAFPERRYLWTSRFLVISAAISCSFTIILAMTLFLLIPQRGALPILLEKDNNHYTLRETSPQEISINAKEILEERAVREYVTLRHEILSTYAKTTNRWQRGSVFHHLSGDIEYNRFLQTMNYKLIAKIIASKLIRKVKIDYAQKLKNNLWMVQFSTITTSEKRKTPTIAYWRAYIRFVFKPLQEGDMISSSNPLQIKIINYALSSLGKEGDAESYLETAKNIATSENKN